MLAFARKPAPVQVSWIGYFDTTGLAAIDYRLADVASVPAGAERYFVERIERLPRSANCYLPPPVAIDVAPAPALRNGHVTFGCFNNPAKVTRDVVRVFARILRAVQGSRLVLKYGAFEDAGIRAQYLAWLAEERIEAGRVELRGHSSMSQFLASFADIDVALDPFPYSGETTALHTLWMGVPLVALEGETLVRRLATRVLHVAGLSSWVAASEDDYVRIAIDAARDVPRLAAVRAELRDRLTRSPLFDHVGVTRELEEALRSMWRRWCGEGRPSTPTRD
jgi:predicted O-linked N-acetylglucosamine transferase (SPINDLY family)